MTTKISTKFEKNSSDIVLESFDYHPSNGLNEHYLSFVMSGTDLNIEILGSLRRICLNYIPVYGFAPELINITENTSIAFNNDMMRLDLSYLPIRGVDPELYEIDETYWHNVNYSDVARKIHPNEKNIELYLQKTNTTNDYMRVTTDDAIVHVDNVQVDMYDKKYPILLIELKPKQSIKCHMKAVLGIAEKRENGSIWKSARNAYYDEFEEGRYKFTVYGNDVINEYDLLTRACSFMVNKLAKTKLNILDKINNGEINPQNEMELIFENEDHTIVTPINYELQNESNILRAGMAKPDLLIKNMIIIAETLKGTVVDSLLNAIHKLEQKFHKLGYLFSKMNPNKKKSESETETETESETESETETPLKKLPQKVTSKVNPKKTKK